MPHFTEVPSEISVLKDSKWEIERRANSFSFAQYYEEIIDIMKYKKCNFM
jgi:hypothetical protein